MTPYQRRVLFRAAREGNDILANHVQNYADEQAKLAVNCYIEQQQKSTPWNRFMAWWDRAVNGVRA